MLLASSLILQSGDCKKSQPITICGTQCSSTAPWTVESLDMGNPCFATQTECQQWAATHGYSDKPCVKCDR